MPTYLYELKLVEGSRPADVLVDGWDRAKPAAFDVTVTSPLTPVTLNEASIHEGAAALAAETRKHVANDARPSTRMVMHSSCRGNVWKLGKRGTMCFSLGYSAGYKTRSTQVFSCQGYLWLPQHLTGEVCG